MKSVLKTTAISLLVLGFLFCGSRVEAQVNAGFIDGIWYSKTPFFAGETIKIYTAIQNQSGSTISGVVKFFDNGMVIGESGFSVATGKLLEKSITWKVTEGEHKIQIKIFDTKKITASGSEEVVSIDYFSPRVDEAYADIDTDKDGIGNKDDKDDDGDSISDKDEEKAGTNPLVVDKKVEKSTQMVNSEEEVGIGGEDKVSAFVEPAKEVVNKVLDESKPIIEGIGDLLKEKESLIKLRIEEDKIKSQNNDLVSVQKSSFYENLDEKLPPVFRLLYSWLLKFLILVFSVWWIPFTIFVLIILKIIFWFFRKLRGGE